jgi:hypothetical protein
MNAAGEAYFPGARFFTSTGVYITGVCCGCPFS